MVFEAQVSSGVSLGTEISASSTDDVQQSHRSSQDIVLAYQLHIITHKGWRRNKHVEITVYKPKAAFLNEQDGAVKEEPVETNAASEEDVCAFDATMPVEALSAMDRDELCTCIMFNKEYNYNRKTKLQRRSYCCSLFVPYTL